MADTNGIVLSTFRLCVPLMWTINLENKKNLFLSQIGSKSVLFQKWSFGIRILNFGPFITRNCFFKEPESNFLSAADNLVPPPPPANSVANLSWPFLWACRLGLICHPVSSVTTHPHRGRVEGIENTIFVFLLWSIIGESWRSRKWGNTIYFCLLSASLIVSSHPHVWSSQPMLGLTDWLTDWVGGWWSKHVHLYSSCFPSLPIFSNATLCHTTPSGQPYLLAKPPLPPTPSSPESVCLMFL